MGQLTYTTQEVQDRLDAIGTFTRPNLLDNWYFVGGGSQQGGGQFPINQRGQTSYAAVGYTIDMWRLWSSDLTVSVTSAGLKLTPASGSPKLFQFLENFEILYGQTVTVSALIGSELVTASGTFSSTAWISGQYTNGYLQFICNNGADASVRIEASSEVVVKAVKLELGDTQTLAHQENGVWVLNEIPNYQQEQEKCQRYQIALVPPGNSAIGCIGGGTPTSSTQCYVFIPTPTELRTVPTLTYAGTWKLVREGTAPASGAAVSAMSVVNRSTNGVTLQITSSGLSTSYRYDLWYTAADATNKLLLSANL